MGNNSLTNARRAKNDEFYTQYETIEKELTHYRDHFKDNVVYLNCDDYRWSNFFRYFVNNFHELELKELIASHHVDKSYNLFTINEGVPDSYCVRYKGEAVSEILDFEDNFNPVKLKGDGDFRSEESIGFLKEADIVVTNPPFSLFRKFIALMVEHDKKFLVIGNMIATNYKVVFPLIKENKMWPGVTFNKIVEFEVPDHYDTSKSIEKDGKKLIEVPAISWWTNLDYGREYEDIELTALYKGNEDKYLKYDNYEAINIDKTAEIPKDYRKIMGVPITFIGKWNPEQFEILGITKSWNNNKYKSYPGIDAPIINGQALYTRILIQNKRLNPEIYGDGVNLDDE